MAKRNGSPIALAPTAPEARRSAHLQPAPPPGVPITPDEWDAMPAEERQAALAWLAEEQAQTTDGVQITFPRVKYPTSGASFWEVPTATGEPEAVKAIEGVVVFKQPVRAYWPAMAEVGNTPPTCASMDSLVPVASPTQQAPTCGACPQAQWGSGKDGRGQACKSRLNVFLVQPGEEIPTLLSLPPTALKAFGQYAVQLRKMKIPLIGITTIFGLTDAKSGGGMTYKGIALKIGRRLTFAEMKQAHAVRELFEQAMAQRGIQIEEAKDDGPEATGASADPY